MFLALFLFGFSYIFLEPKIVSVSRAGAIALLIILVYLSKMICYAANVSDMSMDHTPLVNSGGATS